MPRPHKRSAYENPPPVTARTADDAERPGGGETMGDTRSGRDPVEELAEEFAARYRRGEHPSVTEYTDKYPELAERIRALFPALLIMEQVRSAGGPPTGPFDP